MPTLIPRYNKNSRGTSPVAIRPPSARPGSPTGARLPSPAPRVGGSPTPKRTGSPVPARAGSPTRSSSRLEPTGRSPGPKFSTAPASYNGNGNGADELAVFETQVRRLG